jgi:hypothetical protein
MEQRDNRKVIPAATWEAPQIEEIGKADVLTLGSAGGQTKDNCQCTFTSLIALV